MLLHLPRQGVKVARARVRRERLPGRERGAGSRYRRILIWSGALRDAGENLAGRRIGAIEALATLWFAPRAIDEVAKAALVARQPGQGLLRVLGRGAVLHADEFFDHAHWD